MSTKGSDHAFAKKYQSGLTKREYFAAMAMQGLIRSTIEHGESYQDQAEHSLRMADAPIEELNKESR